MTKKIKIRLDEYLVKKGLADNIKEASSLCIQGLVHDASKKLLKPGAQINSKNALEVKVKKNKLHNYVSRSALKLKQAIKRFDIQIQNKVCSDLGCSTGGFTQILLEEGASLVYCVDVGYGILAQKLRNHTKVVLLERTNVRFLDNVKIPLDLDIMCADLSFIGLGNALRNPLHLLKKGGSLIALIKPQFELPKHLVGEKGIVKNPLLHKKACDDVIEGFVNEHNLKIIGIIPCDCLGTKGNQEFLLYAIK